MEYKIKCFFLPSYFPIEKVAIKFNYNLVVVCLLFLIISPLEQELETHFVNFCASCSNPSLFEGTLFCIVVRRSLNFLT